MSEARDLPAPLPLVFVVAVGRNGVIGGDNRLPWRLPSDLRRFKALTLGKPMLMGRKTYESIGKPLPGRESIVVSRDAGFAARARERAEAAGLGTMLHVVADLDAAIALGQQRGRAMGAREIAVVGGGDIYRQTIDRAARLYVTEVDLAPAGDARMPAIDPARWRETLREAHAAEPGDEASYAFVVYDAR